MRVILIIAFVVAFGGLAQADQIIWHKGSVVLSNKEVVVGDIARQGFDLLLLRDAKGSVDVLAAHEVSTFRYYDTKENVNRTFFSIANRYYERVVSGRISVFRIQKMFHEEIDEKHSEAFDFFIEEGKTIYSISSFRKKFFDKIRDELELQLISYKQFDPNTRHGAVSLILLYNKASVPVI
ncbi:MAG: hypothetical protein WDO14_02665 [Bacteroidota bacterium]